MYLSNQRKDLNLLQQRMISPVQLAQKLRVSIDHFNLRLISETKKNITNSQVHVRSIMSLLDSLSPLRVVDRGFSITQKKNKVVKSVQDVQINDDISIQVTDGYIKATVKGVQNGI